MHRLLIVGLTAFLSLSLATVAFAQLQPNDVVVSFDQLGTQTTGNPPVFTTTNNFFIVASNVDGGVGIAGFEFDLFIDPNILTFGVPVIVPPGSPINVGDGPNELIVGLGNCAPSAGEIVLVQFTYGVFTPGLENLLICLLPATPSSFAPAVPGFLTCDSGLIPFGVGAQSDTYGGGCAVVYESAGEPPVATIQDSFGSVKGRF